jgi:uncharacterized protein (DUF2267 family)
VALDPKRSALDAARAIENNNIGVVVIQNKGRVVGIVTDRDLTVRVLGRGLDPRATLLEQVMTTPVVTLSPSDSQIDAIRLMQEKNIRRIPLVEAERFVGIVALDDLLLDEAAPLDELAAIVAAQIGEGGPMTPLEARGRQRRAARAEATYKRLLRRFQEEASLENAEEAEIALNVVLKSLVRRLTPGEAKDLIAQLPSLMQPELSALATGPDKFISRRTIEAELVQRLGVVPGRAADLLAAVGGTLTQIISAGQMNDVQGQLPDDLRGVFSDIRTPAA